MTTCTTIFPWGVINGFVKLARGGDYLLGVVFAIINSIWGVESGLFLKNFPGCKVNLISIEISPINNNLFVIGSIDLFVRVWDIYIRNFVQNHEGHESDTNTKNTFGTVSYE